ncbi:hypothetical protein C0Q70_21318 [Pomacea canaliculata]|uniref:H/ACA ribonucleoprotein complex subunit n=1 Tax=Pomacea canaliculata TaxID=400727 RepID=A0A2T7NC60_POMCA|nr:hypothetical protein C0Q70_21318 [Pomacea canaliculata]
MFIPLALTKPGPLRMTAIMMSVFRRSGKEMETFSITRIRKSILQKIQQYSQEITITKEEYRITQDSNSEDEETHSPDSDTDTSSLSDEDQRGLATKKKGVKEEASDEEDDKNLKKNCFDFEDIRTTGELFPEELPPIEELTIDVDANTQMEEVGIVSGVVGVQVVIHSRPGISSVQDDTVFFGENRTPIGQVFEVFGPVVRPYYSIRFNSPDDIKKKGIQMGMPVYFAPEMPEITHYIFVEQLKRLKGSDASWKDNNEPTADMIEYSDDEEERRAKAKRRGRCEAEAKEAQDSPESSRTSAPTGIRGKRIIEIYRRQVLEDLQLPVVNGSLQIASLKDFLATVLECP